MNREKLLLTLPVINAIDTILVCMNFLKAFKDSEKIIQSSRNQDEEGISVRTGKYIKGKRIKQKQLKISCKTIFIQLFQKYKIQYF